MTFITAQCQDAVPVAKNNCRKNKERNICVQANETECKCEDLVCVSFKADHKAKLKFPNWINIQVGAKHLNYSMMNKQKSR